MAVAILANVNLRNGCSPGGVTFKLDVIDIDGSINDVHVNTLTTGWDMIIESESSEVKPAMVRGTCKTLGGGVITNHATRAGFRNIPAEQSAEGWRLVQRDLVRHKRLLAHP